MNLLLAEDDKCIQKIISDYLKKQGFKVFIANNGEEALCIFYSEKIDLAILDWMMPIISGIDVCKEIKLQSNTKVLMLTAKSQDEDELKALSIGADDYIKKPFDPRILLIRVKKLLNINNEINIKNLKVYIDKNKVYKNNDEIKLTKTEWELLKYFIINKGKILSKNTLIDYVWGIDYDGDLNTLTTHITRLRKKIGEDIIKTYKGMGYSLEINND